MQIARKEKAAVEERHPYEVGTHMPSPGAYGKAMGGIELGAEIVVLIADHAANRYAIMDCLTGLVVRDVALPDPA